MTIELLLKFVAPALGFITTVFSLVTVIQKQKARRIELVEKLSVAMKSETPLFAMEVFAQLYGKRYKYSDIEILMADDDALQKLFVLRKRGDAITFQDGEYKPTSIQQSWFGKFYLLYLKFGVITFLAMLALLIVIIFSVGFLDIKLLLLSALLLALCACAIFYFGNELILHKEASRILEEERLNIESDVDSIK